MNNVSLLGRLTRDPNVRHTNDSMVIANFNLAVDRPVKRDSNEQTADFIDCTAFGKTAELVDKYFTKGKRMALTGKIQTGSYTNKEGQKIYTTTVIADRIEFCDSKSDGQSQGRPASNSRNSDQGFVNVQDDVADEELPFL